MFNKPLAESESQITEREKFIQPVMPEAFSCRYVGIGDALIL